MAMNLAEMIEWAGGVLLFDGGMGSMIARRNLVPLGGSGDLLVLSDPQSVIEIHREYVQAGAAVITTNTFGANARRLAGRASVAEVFEAAVFCARAAGARLVAADIGPLGVILEPYGDMEEEEAFALFTEEAASAAAAHADLIIIETMSDIAEAKLALRALKEQTILPVISSMSFNANGFTSFGTTPEKAVAELSALGADAVGMNCSTGPQDMLPLVKRMVACSAVPVLAEPNAGIPEAGPSGEAVYTADPQEFAEYVQAMVKAGVQIVGGCCGTDPAFIQALAKRIS